MRRDHILTLSCPDTTGIVYRVTGLLYESGCNILDAQQFGDDESGRFFLRVHFDVPGATEIDVLHEGFASLAEIFTMDWQLHDASRKARLMVLVSKQGHCLNDLLFRVHSRQLPVEIACIASNHADFAPLAQSYGVAFHQRDDLLFLRGLVGRADRQVMERHAIRGGKRRELIMVGYHADNIHRQLAAVRAEQQVVEAMSLFAHQHQQARAPLRIVDLPVHAKYLGQRGEAFLQRPHFVHIRRIKMHAQEEAPAFNIAELLRVGDVAARFKQQAGHAVDDTGAVGAGQGKDVIGAHAEF